VPSAVIGTAGHIDHGKSALVRALTGTDPDRLKEEQERGITIDLGFAHLTTGGTNLAFVDVPGHERFVKNMLAGVGGVDLVLLVVAADESVMPQTREHFDICRLLGVTSGVIALTKIDLADAEMQDLATLEVRELTAGSFLADAPLVKVSAKTGEGLEELLAAIVTVSAKLPHRDVDRPARLPIDRIFTVRGFGTVVTGTLVAGRMAVDDGLVVQPADAPVRARGLHVHGQVRSATHAGERVAVNLGGVAVADVTRGDTLCAPAAGEVTRRVDVVLDLLSTAPPLKHGARVRFHQGTAEVMGRVALAGLRSVSDKGTDGDRRGDVRPGESAYARIRLESPVLLTRGDRFILRGYSPVATVGGGVVLDPLPPRGAMRTAAGRRRFERLDSRNGAAGVVQALIDERGAAGVPRDALVSRLGLTRSDAAAVGERLVAAGAATVVGTSLVQSSAIDALADALVAAVGRHHEAHPHDEGLAREEARERVFGHAAAGVFDRVLERLAQARILDVRDTLSVSNRRVTVSAEDAAAMAAIEQVFRDARLAPPDVPTATAQSGVGADVAARALLQLLKKKRLVRLDALHFHAEVLEDLKRDMRGLRESGATAVDVATFKERYDLSRKYAIPLLEYLDRERVTRRVGPGRVLV
jgi:selenocysteine-specific elongation factor